jgi:hypothetical protein
MDIAILKSKRYPPKGQGGDRCNWKQIIEHLEKRKFEVCNEPRDTDVSIVLSGLMENPAVLKGRKVLAFKPQDWMPEIPPPKGWMLYEKVMRLYYDEFIDLSGLNPKKSAKRIIEYINEIKEPGSQD